MLINSEEDIIQLVYRDEWMMNILREVSTLQLPDWWVCAGFVRSKIWDTLHGFTERTPLADVDVVYFDPSNLDEKIEKQLENTLNQMNPHVPWSVKNQARMHVINNNPPYSSSTDAISKFPETVTALGLKIDQHDKLVLTAPCGIEDVLEMIVRPSPFYLEYEDRIAIYEKRLEQKRFQERWPKVRQ
ncbi:nucleotidyltransferase family protein [Paenibacillus sp. NRS-1760]|uniref:nucleotidyltransferase family protein n=1 Tax=Paenibacillus sp. NRS-1760 TaxID=3233902 RepID=UPI003D2B406C